MEKSDAQNETEETEGIKRIEKIERIKERGKKKTQTEIETCWSLSGLLYADDIEWFIGSTFSSGSSPISV